MTDAGRAAIERARADGSWSLLEPVEAGIVPPDLAAAMAALDGAAASWERLSASARQAYLFWVYSAKRPATRERRVTESASLIAQGKRLDER